MYFTIFTLMYKLGTNTPEETSEKSALHFEKLLKSLEICFYARLSLMISSFLGNYPCKLSEKLIEFPKSKAIWKTLFKTVQIVILYELCRNNDNKLSANLFRS